MKFKTKVKAVALAVGIAMSGSSNAAINDDNGGLAFAGTGDGELWVSIYDVLADQTFVWDTNVTANTFRSTIQNNSTAGTGAMFQNADMQTFLANVADPAALKWTVAATSNLGSTSPLSVENIGILTTASTLPTVGVTAPLGLLPMSRVQGTAAGHIGNLNAALKADDRATTGQTTASVDTVIVIDPASPAQHTFGWGENWGNGSDFQFTTNQFGLGKIDMLWMAVDPTQVTTASTVQTVGTWELSTAGLNYVSAVPLPAAVWLLGSAMIGLVGVARRRS